MSGHPVVFFVVIKSSSDVTVNSDDNLSDSVAVAMQHCVLICVPDLRKRETFVSYPVRKRKVFQSSTCEYQSSPQLAVVLLY